MQSGLIFNIQRFSIQDGPGIRTTVFFKGCPASCVWCHNPESQSSRPEILVMEGRCVHCGTCAEACPQGFLAASDSERRDQGLTCTLCGTCVEACPTGARQLAGRTMTLDEVLREILKDRIFFDGGGGGVTFSGGEPLLQAAFLRQLLDACRSQGIHTAVDTCGFAPSERLLEVARMTDLFLYDLKIMDGRRHRELTGVSNAPILENLRALGRIHDAIWVRVPVIPGVNDDLENLEATARFTATIDGVRQVSLLPYHATAVQKFRRLGRTYGLDAVRPPSTERLEALARPFRRLGLETRTGG